MRASARAQAAAQSARPHPLTAPPAPQPNLHITVCSRQGPRPDQQDRYALQPRLLGREDCVFTAVLDGTVGFGAAESARELLPATLAASLVRAAPAQGGVGAALGAAGARAPPRAGSPLCRARTHTL